MRGLSLAAIALVLAPGAAAHPQPWAVHARREPEPDRRPVPILEYHALGPVGPGYPELYLSRRTFTRQVDGLARPRRRFSLDRIEILASDGLAGFVRKLRGAR